MPLVFTVAKICPIDKEHGHMKEEHTQDGNARVIKYTCDYPGCRGHGKDLETKEELNLREESQAKPAI